MNAKLPRLLSILMLGAGLGLAAAQVDAQTTLTFNRSGTTGILSQAQVLNYYNGGQAGYPDPAPGPSYGVSFGEDAFAENATNGKFSGLVAGSGNEVLYFTHLTTGTNSTSGLAYNPSITIDSAMDVASGFTSLSLEYSSYNSYAGYSSSPPSTSPATIAIYSGLDGTGTLLATLNLAINDTPSSCASGITFCSWSNVSINASSWGGQAAQSAVFTNAAIDSEFSAVQLTEAPLPAAAWLFFSGLGGLAAFARTRRA